LLGLAAAGGATAADIGGGFVSLAVFGLALSLPLARLSQLGTEAAAK
jgi:cytochrome c-type biogenesis protein